MAEQKQGDSRGDPEGDNQTEATKLNSVQTILQRILKPQPNQNNTDGAATVLLKVNQPKGKEFEERQEVNALQVERQAGINGGEKVSGENDGWQTVISKRNRKNLTERQPELRRDNQWKGKQATNVSANKWHNKVPFKPGNRVNLTDEIHHAYERAFKERRCLRCLGKDHKRAQCREPVRCFSCNCLGHKSGRCNKRNPRQPIKEIQAKVCVERKVVHDHTYAQAVRAKEKAVPRAPPQPKEVQPPPAMEPFWDVRPEERQVFMHHEEGLRPQVDYLRHTGMVVMTQGPATALHPAQIARRLARRFGWNPQTYEVHRGNPNDDAPFVLICPREDFLRQVVWNSPYMIQPGVEFGVIPWNRDWNLAYDPPPFQAWIRLVNLPYQAWNIDDLRKVTTKLGKITAVLPYGRQAGHFRHITLRINCEDPQEIPKNLKYREGSRAARVRVILLHSRQWEDSPYPLQHAGWGPAPNPLPLQQQPQHGNAQNHSSTTETEGGDDAQGDSSGGSNSINMLAKQHKQQKRLVLWKVKSKLKGPWLPKKKKDTTPKAAKESSPQKNKEIKIFKPTLQVTQAVNSADKVTKAEVMVTFKRQEGCFFVRVKEAGQKLTHTNAKILPQLLSQMRLDLKCMVLGLELFQGKGYEGFFEKLNCLGRMAAGFTNTGCHESKSPGQKGGAVLALTNGAKYKDGEAALDGLQQAGRNAIEEAQGAEYCIWGADEFNGPAEAQHENPKEDANLMGLHDHSEHSTDTDEAQDHPPGFPEAKYLKGSNSDPHTEKKQPRRSPRIKAKQNYAEEKRAKQEKLKIDFDKRTKEIEVELAIGIIEEAGTTLTPEIRALFFEAQAGQLAAKEKAPEEATESLLQIDSAPVLNE